MGEEVEITTKSLSFRCLCAFPRISAPVSIPPWRIALTWQFEREEPRGAMLRPRLLSGLFVCLFPGIECRLSSSCSRVFSPAGFFVLFPAVFRGFLSSIPRISAPVYIPPDAIRHPLLSVHPSRILARAITQTTLPFLTGLLHSHPRFYSPGMGSSEPLLISPVLPPNPTLAQIIVCGIIST